MVQRPMRQLNRHMELLMFVNVKPWKGSKYINLKTYCTKWNFLNIMYQNKTKSKLKGPKVTLSQKNNR